MPQPICTLAVTTSAHDGRAESEPDDVGNRRRYHFYDRTLPFGEECVVTLDTCGRHNPKALLPACLWRISSGSP
ncbi:hypothetical protein [Candidatus Desulfovibrio trichonymphae]|uniref:hypothetical protein n=1 Tax=Candidatus Desulfovibrio trichonymphae TaxID=1725232 RepID=UPI0011AB4070|nr:hypothetical protein [Candidatus Desulfovibrio trichonymphae]